MMKYYVLFIEGDVEPSLYGYYDTPKDRDDKAKALKREYGDKHGIYMLNVGKDGIATMDAYSAGFFTEEG